MVSVHPRDGTSKGVKLILQEFTELSICKCPGGGEKVVKLGIASFPSHLLWAGVARFLLELLS